MPDNIWLSVQECMKLGTAWRRGRGACSWGAPSLCRQGLDFWVMLSPQKACLPALFPLMRTL